MFIGKHRVYVIYLSLTFFLKDVLKVHCKNYVDIFSLNKYNYNRKKYFFVKLLRKIFFKYINIHVVQNEYINFNKEFEI